MCQTKRLRVNPLDGMKDELLIKQLVDFELRMSVRDFRNSAQGVDSGYR